MVDFAAHVLTQAVIRLLHSSVRSVWELEVLLLLYREPARAWRPEELVRHLRASPLIVHDALFGLTRAGLLEAGTDAAFRSRGADQPETRTLIAQLQEAYVSFPGAVTQAIWSAPDSRVQVFADAFRLKRD